MNKEKLLHLLGWNPEPCALNVDILSEVDRDTYKRILIEYSTEPNERVQAFLLVPDDLSQLCPAILAIHQDGSHRPYEFGKSEPAGVSGDPEMAYGKELVERGYVVICPDRFPFESRMLSRSKHIELFNLFRIFMREDDQIEELELTEDLYAGCVGNLLQYEGRTLEGKTQYELGRAIDVLCGLPYVDSNRIGVIGHSGGGFASALAMYLDNRIKVGCASCGTFLMADMYTNLRPINGFGGCIIPGLKQLGDIDDILAGIAPRPYLETSGDFTSNEELERVHRKAKSYYSELGFNERYQTIAYGAGHMFRTDMRQLSYEWFDRWLRNPIPSSF